MRVMHLKVGSISISVVIVFSTGQTCCARSKEKCIVIVLLQGRGDDPIGGTLTVPSGTVFPPAPSCSSSPWLLKLGGPGRVSQAELIER